MELISIFQCFDSFRCFWLFFGHFLNIENATCAIHSDSLIRLQYYFEKIAFFFPQRETVFAKMNFKSNGRQILHFSKYFFHIIVLTLRASFELFSQIQSVSHFLDNRFST